MRSWVDIYSTHGLLLIQPNGRTSVGLWTPGGTTRKLADSISDEELGAAAYSGLAESGRLPVLDGINRTRPERRASGLRRQRDFMAGTRLVSALGEETTITLKASENESPRKPRGGFYTHIRTPQWTLDSPSFEELGHTIRLALDACTFAEPKKPRRVRAAG